MEITRLGNTGVKVKAKNTTFLVDPADGKLEGDVIVLYNKPHDYSKFQGKLIIDGPGEYEIGGVSVKVERTNGHLSFDFLEDGQKLCVISDPSIAKDIETEDAKAVLVKLDGEFSDDIFSSIRSEVVSFYGQDEFLPKDKDTLKKADKINLRKTEDLKGYLVYLGK